jgi:hypothetical protein
MYISRIPLLGGNMIVLKGYSNKTKKAYVGHIRRMIEYLNMKPKDIPIKK